MAANEILFHKMARKAYELAAEGPLVPTKEDLSLLLEILAVHVKDPVACAALELASGELSNDMGWVTERNDCLRTLEDTLMGDTLRYNYFKTGDGDNDVCGWVKSY